jgi:integrase
VYQAGYTEVVGSVFNRGSKDRPNWYGKFKDETGRWKTVPTKQSTKVQARRWVEEIEQRISDGRVGIEMPKDEKTFAAAIAYWLETHSAAALTSHDDNVGRAKVLIEHFGHLRLSEINHERIDSFRASCKRQTKEGPKGTRLPKWAVATINRMLALLRKVLNDSAHWGWITAAPKVKLLPQPETDFEYLRKDEASRFLSWTAEHAADTFPLYAAAVYTGARMGELYGLCWVDVDLDQRVVTISRSYEQPYTKSKKIRRVPLNSELVDILRRWRPLCPPGELVFPRPDGTMRRSEKRPNGFKEHLVGAKVHAITFHDLRHTAASLMVMAGVSLRTVQKILGHSVITTTERYAHLAPDFMANEADRLSFDLKPAPNLVAL